MSSTVSQRLLSLVEIEAVDAESITAAILRELQGHSLDPAGILSQCYDGASVMSEVKGGMQKLLQSADNLPASLIQRLQSVQNAAARLIFNMRRSEHITDALISLHWLRVPERIIFKVATLTFCALHGTAPPYITSQFTRVADMPNRRRLRSASSNQLDVPSFRLPTVGSRAFPIAGAKVWNSLPDVTSAPSLSTFRRHLKTHLFRCCYNIL